MLTLSLFGCQQIEERIDSVSSRVDEIENTQIASIKKQLASMDESVGKLEQTDRELKVYIETLQGTADDLRKSISDSDAKIEALQRSLDQAIKDAQNSDSALKSELEQQITSAKTDVLSQLASAKTAMESRLEQIESTIKTLQQKDADLEKKITDLRTYVDSKIKSDLDSGINFTKDWATATFATLEQYNAIVSDISDIRGSIATLETSLKSLEDSLTGRIQTVVSNAIAPIKDQMVSEAAAEVVVGYTEAISSVRSEVEEISSRMKAIEDEVKLIKEDVDNIKKEIEKINSKLDSGQSGGIQSIIFVPEYSDGKATMYFTTGTDGSFIPGEAELRFEVYPAAMADKLAAEWETSLSVKLLYTITRAAAGESIELPVTGAFASDGILTVTVSGEKIDDKAFFLKELPASVRLLATIDGTQKASEYISIYPSAPDAIYVPDAIFKKYLIDNFDVNHDREFTPIDASTVTSIDISNKGVYSLVGVEHCTNLVSLDCRNNCITELDLSGCHSLQTLQCYGNQLKRLKLDGCDRLAVMYIADEKQNAISGKSILLSGFNQADTFELSLPNTPFTSLSFSGGPKFASLSIDGDFTEIKIFSNSNLISVDVSKLLKLESLDVSGCELLSLDVTKNIKLESLDVSGCELLSLDVTKNIKLESLNVSGCELLSLDVTKNLNLKRLLASFLAITKLDLTANAQLYILDLTGNTSLSRVVCPSQNWLDNVCVLDNHNISFVDRSGRKLQNSVGVKIDGVYWAAYNVGASDDDLYGNCYNFDDAQNACPSGWRTPTYDELKSLSANCFIVDGMRGCWFSGSKTCSTSVPAVFLPYNEVDYSNGKYWSSTEIDSSGAYGMHFHFSSAHMYNCGRSRAYSVRCVKN